TGIGSSSGHRSVKATAGNSVPVSLAWHLLLAITEVHGHGTPAGDPRAPSPCGGNVLRRNPPMKVGLFIPCYIDAFFPEVGIATLELLERLRCSIEDPPQQTRCGAPVGTSGV